MAANQRWRLLGACAEILRERGYAGTSVANVTKAAAVSKVAFYRNFDGLPTCLLATFRLATEGVLAVIGQTCRGRPVPGADPTEALAAVFEFLQAEGDLAYVLTDAALDDVPGVSVARAEFTARCCALLISARTGQESCETDQQAQHLVRGMQGWVAMQLALGGDLDRPGDLARILALQP